jgi:hypothetical protein
MYGISPESGLSARDFHPEQRFVDPTRVFPARGRQSSRGRLRSPPSHQYALPSLGSPTPLGYCSLDERPRTPCVTLGDNDEKGCCDLDSDPSSPKSCEGDCEKCEDCLEDHQLCPDQEDCVKDCNDCLDEHQQACGQQHGPVCMDTCDDCDFSCFDCIDWTEFEKDKSLGLSYSVPLLGQENEFNLDPTSLDFAGDLNKFSTTMSPQESLGGWTDSPVAPMDVAMHHQCTDNTYWNGMLEAQMCSDPNAFVYQQPIVAPPTQPQGWLQPLPQFGCHPAALHFQKPQIPVNPRTSAVVPTPVSTPSTQTTDLVCQWLMPCGNTCSASFASITDLKKHLKAAHCTKGIFTCAWGGCTSTFNSEAALTGHISKKHLAAAISTANASSSQTPSTSSSTHPHTASSQAPEPHSGPFKCTFPGCTKSFMYKQVLLSHLASHSGDNKAYCHICDTFLNAEGSNFRRHMASHRPKHEHLICKWHHLGCKRRFPRLDNLRRHEGCCKYGKKVSFSWRLAGRVFCVLGLVCCGHVLMNARLCCIITIFICITRKGWRIRRRAITSEPKVRARRLVLYRPSGPRSSETGLHVSPGALVRHGNLNSFIFVHASEPPGFGSTSAVRATDDPPLQYTWA